MTQTSSVGVIDSGVGGLTTVRELVKLLPGENIVYCGDNGNAPYGNRTEDEIVALTKAMLKFLQQREVKIVAVACNTISSTFESPRHGGYQKEFGFPVLSIIRSAAEDVVRQGYKEVGVIATAFTVQSQCYNQLIQAIDPSIHVHGEPSRNLAALIEKGHLDSPEIRQEVQMHLSNLLSAYPVKDIVLGCTHYPIVQGIFESMAPDVAFINPARDQALEVRKMLQASGLLNPGSQGKLDIHTSGTQAIYDVVLEELSIKQPHTLTVTTF